MKIKLQNVRLAFPDLFEATQYQGQGPFNYGAQFLTPDADPVVVATGADGRPVQTRLSKVIEKVAADKWGAKAQANLAGIKSNPQRFFLVDGNTKAYDGFAGNWAISAKRPQDKGRPLVIDNNRAALTAADGKPYAGCYVNATVEIWAQDNNFGKGIRATLLGVQFVRDGDAFGGGGSRSTEDDFDDIAVSPEMATDLV